MSSFIKVNVSALSSCQGEFSDEQSYFNNNTYTTFSNGYVCSCGDQYISQMASHMSTCYDTLKAGYTNINDWWTSYVSDVETLENVLSGQSDLGEITSPELIAALGKLYNTDNYDNTLEGEYTGEEDPSIFGIDDQSTIDAAYNQGEVEGKDNVLVGLSKEYLTKVTDSCVDIYNEDGTINVMNVIKNIGTIRLNMIKITTATQTTGCLGLAEGILDFGESLFDLGVEGVTWAATGLQTLNGILNGTDYEKANEELWEQTRSFVAKDHVTSLFNKFYETEAGSVIKNNTVAFDAVRGITKGIGYTAGVVGLSTVTGGTFTPMFVGAAAGYGSASEEAWANGASVEEGLKYAAGKAAWEATQFSVSAFTKPFAMGWRVAGDVFMGGLEGVVDPALKTTYKKGTYDENGNFVAFTSSDSGWDRFTKLFDESGGLLNVAKQAAIGGGTSLLGEYFDSLKSKNNVSPKVVEGEIVPDDNFIENPKPELPPNQTIIDVEGERIGVDYETLDGDVIKDLPTGSKDLIEEFDAEGIGDGSVKGLPPGADDIDVTTNSKNLTDDLSTEKLDIFKESEIPKTKVTGSSGDIETLGLEEAKPIAATSVATGDISVLQALDDADVPKKEISKISGEVKKINLEKPISIINESDADTSILHAIGVDMASAKESNLVDNIETLNLKEFDSMPSLGVDRLAKTSLSASNDVEMQMPYESRLRGSAISQIRNQTIRDVDNFLSNGININNNNYQQYLDAYNKLVDVKNSAEIKSRYMNRQFYDPELGKLDADMLILEHHIRRFSSGIESFGEETYKNRSGITMQVNKYRYNGVDFYEQANIDQRKMSFQIVLEAYNKVRQFVGDEKIKKIKHVFITDVRNPADDYWGKIHGREFHSAATGGGDEIEIWKYSDKDYLDKIFAHETGHVIDDGRKTSNSRNWRKAVTNDGNFASLYAEEAFNKRSVDKYAEDFADSLANLYKMGTVEFQRKYPHRYEILKQILSETGNTQSNSGLKNMLKKLFE